MSVRFSPRRRLMAVVGAVALAGGLVSACGSSSDASGGSTIVVGTSGATGVYLPLYVAVQTGMFKDAGLDVKVQTLTPQAVTAAVLSDNVNLGWDGPGMVGGILSNPSAKVIMTAGPTVFYLYGDKDIHSINDLKGKTVGVTTPGGAIDTAVRTAITKAGMTPGKDVKIAYLQTNSAALAAVQSGSVDGAGVSPPTSTQAEQAGLNQLENITDDSPGSVFAANSKWAKSHGSEIKKFISVLKEATTKAGTDKTAADNALKTYVKITDQKQMDDVQAAYKSVWVVQPFPEDQMVTILKGLATSNPPVKGASTAKPSDVIDNSYISAQ